MACFKTCQFVVTRGKVEGTSQGTNPLLIDISVDISHTEWFLLKFWAGLRPCFGPLLRFFCFDCFVRPPTTAAALIYQSNKNPAHMFFLTCLASNSCPCPPWYTPCGAEYTIWNFQKALTKHTGFWLTFLSNMSKNTTFLLKIPFCPSTRHCEHPIVSQPWALKSKPRDGRASISGPKKRTGNWRRASRPWQMPRHRSSQGNIANMCTESLPTCPGTTDLSVCHITDVSWDL